MTQIEITSKSEGGSCRWTVKCDRLLDYRDSLYDDVDESVDSHLIICGVISQNVGLRLRNRQRARFVSIPDGVKKLCELGFFRCWRLSRVTFGESSSFELIGREAFYGSAVVEIHIPDAVEKLGDGCLCECKSLSHVTFGDCSSLRLIGKKVFSGSCVREIHILDSVEELCESCFYECKSLSHVTFRESSSLKLIEKEAFSDSAVVEIYIPDAIGRLLRDRSTGRPQPVHVAS